MDDGTAFSETQRFTQGWLRSLFLVVNGVLLYGVVRQVGLGRPFGNRPIGNTGLLIAAGATIFTTLVFFLSRMETRIGRDAIRVRFLPFHFSFRRYGWDRIAKAYLRQYRPIAEYGGWGIRMGRAGKGNAFNVSGTQGLQLEFHDGGKLLIGTNKPDELREALLKIGRYAE